MKLITEQNFDTKFITEENAKGEKEYFLEGIFMQAEVKNRNGRIYKESVLRPAVNQYIKNQVDTKRAVGELNHPSGPTVNYKEVSHTIESLNWDGNNVVGRAKILNTPNGQIVKALLDAGRQIGVSSRGMGSVNTKEGADYIGEDFHLNTIDIVQDPSAPSAFVNGIMEGINWEMVGENYVQVEKTAPKIDGQVTLEEGLFGKKKVTIRPNRHDKYEVQAEDGEMLYVSTATGRAGQDEATKWAIDKKYQWTSTDQRGESKLYNPATFLAFRTFINRIK